MTATTSPERENPANEALSGFFFALSAYLLWGVLPLYLKLIAHLPAIEVLAHRIVWSVPIAAVILWWLGRTADVRAALRSPRTLGMAALTAVFISINWGIYIWAIAAERTVDAALGYYVNPLVSIALAAVFLRERLALVQIAAVGLAAIAVIVLTVETGGLPWLSLSLAMSFAGYGFLRKTLPIGPSQGFFLEVLMLSVPALAYIGWLVARGENHFVASNPRDILLFLGCGPITAIPLILFSFGAKRLRYSTIGIMQYIAPTMMFLIAVFVFREPFGGAKAVAFVLIWSALALYSWQMLREASAKRRASDKPESAAKK